MKKTVATEIEEKVDQKKRRVNEQREKTALTKQEAEAKQKRDLVQAEKKRNQEKRIRLRQAKQFKQKYPRLFDAIYHFYLEFGDQGQKYAQVKRKWYKKVEWDYRNITAEEFLELLQIKKEKKILQVDLLVSRRDDSVYDTDLYFGWSDGTVYSLHFELSFSQQKSQYVLRIWGNEDSDIKCQKVFKSDEEVISYLINLVVDAREVE